MISNNNISLNLSYHPPNPCLLLLPRSHMLSTSHALTTAWPSLESSKGHTGRQNTDYQPQPLTCPLCCCNSVYQWALTGTSDCLTETPSTGLHPSTTAVFSYAIGSRKVSANEQFFVGAQTVVSLLQTTQIKQGVSFIAASKVYTSTNKTTLVCIETELPFFFSLSFFTPGWMRLMFTCVLWR